MTDFNNEGENNKNGTKTILWPGVLLGEAMQKFLCGKTSLTGSKPFHVSPGQR